MKSKKIKVGAVAMALVFAMSGSAFAAGGSAAGGTPGSPSDQEYGQNADTVISIFQSEQNAGNISYTVPLYVTMAVSNGQAKAAVPNTYGIINNSKKENGEAMNLGVTAIKFEKLKGGKFKTTSKAAITDPEEINLKIGEVQMPDMSAPGFKNITLNKDNGGLFWDKTATGDGHLTPIPVSTKLFQIPIDGTVQVATNRTSADGTVAQFRVKYSVALLDNNYKPVGNQYVGSDYVQAGLPDWNVDK